LHFLGSALAVAMKNIDVGVFMFRLDLRAENEVNEAKLSLKILDFAELNETLVFDSLTITDAGQTFGATKADINFPAAAAFLTNGVADRIQVLIEQTPRAISIKGIEPFLLFGDYTGNSGIDLAGLTIESIELQITYTAFNYGFDPEQGSFTDIVIEGEVAISTVPVSTAMFAESYGYLIFDGHYRTMADADGDGDVDGFDLFLFCQSCQ